MKTRLIALAIFAATAATVVFYPPYERAGAAIRPPDDPLQAVLSPLDSAVNGRPVVEVVFVLDTTGSMSGLIQAAKDKIWSIASTLALAQPTPEIRMGLVAYRDRGDTYVTRVVDLSADLDSVHATLMDFVANGGGDGPESVNQALHDAVHKVSWSQDPNAYKVVFLVGDAPPHMDYQDDVQYPATVAVARQRGITVNAIQCGGNASTTREWQRIADLGAGRYFQVEQSGGAVAIATPYDRKLAELSVQLDETRLYYGSAEEKAQQARRQAAAGKLHAESSVASRARRAAFNATEAGNANLLGDKELVDDVARGRVDLSAMEPSLLPAPLQALAPEERKTVVEEKAERRKTLSAEIEELVAQRDEFLKREVTARGGAKDSLDAKLYGAVREQAKAIGLRYESDSPAY